MTTVPLPETDLARIAKYCTDKVPARLRKEMRVEFETHELIVTIVETRPPWRDGSEPWARLQVAQLRYRPQFRDWTLHCRSRSGKWFDYPNPFSGTASELLAAIDADPTGIFWG